MLRLTGSPPSRATSSTFVAATEAAKTTDGVERPRLLSPLLFLALTLLAACGGDDLLLPGAGRPAHISAFAGDRQNATVGTPLNDSLVVKVTDSEDRPVEAVEVVFVPPAGAEVAPNDTLLTDAEGRVAVHYTLSTRAGEQLVKARAESIVPPTAATATFTVLADPENAVSLEAAGGNEQTAEVSTALAESLAVKAVDRFGNGVAGIEVTWDAKNGGDVSPRSVTTGADGRAATQRMLGDRPGSYATTAETDDLDAPPVSFTATAIAAPQPALVLVTQPSSSAIAGAPLEQQPVLQLQDPRGAPLARADVSVTVQIAGGDGSLGGRTTARSDASGRVTFTNLELRGETGSRTLIFAAEGFTPIASSAITVHPGPPSSERSSVSVPGGTAGAATNVRIHLEDQFGNPIVDASDRLSISVEGANPTADLSVRETGDGSYSSSYLPEHSGTDAVIVRFDGSPVAGGRFETVVVAGAADPTRTTAQVVRTGIFFYRIDVTVTVRDAQGNDLGRGGDLVQISVNGGNSIPLVDQGNGTYTGSFGTIATSLTLDITVNGVPIAGSPYTA